MSPALNRALRKAVRTLLQMAAAGGLTALVDLAAHGLAPGAAAAILVVWGTLVAFLHNFLETQGLIPALLPAAGLVTTSVGGLVAKTVGTVDAVTEGATHVVGDVVSTSGKVVGGVAGTVGGLVGAVGGTVGQVVNDLAPPPPETPPDNPPPAG